MKRKVGSLSNAQVTQLHDFIDEYLTIGRSVKPSDRATTERIITSFYRRIGEGSPFTHQEHHTQTIPVTPPGMAWRRDIVREYDHFAEEVRQVAD